MSHYLNNIVAYRIINWDNEVMQFRWALSYIVMTALSTSTSACQYDAMDSEFMCISYSALES
jgi:hypothetical protein